MVLVDGVDSCKVETNNDVTKSSTCALSSAEDAIVVDDVATDAAF